MFPVNWLVSFACIPSSWRLIMDRDLRWKNLSLGILLYRERLNRKEFQILELEFEVGIEESMRGETWVSVSLTSFRTTLD